MVLPAEVRKAWEDDDEFVSRLVIEGLGPNGRVQLMRMHPLLEEQRAFKAALDAYRFVVAIKPRKPGFTTYATLRMFAKAYRAPRRSPRRVIQTVHDPVAFRKVRRMVEVAYDNLPPELQFGLKVRNPNTTEFAHNGSAFDRLIAGKRGQARGETYTDYHATEMAKYPEGTSALKAQDEAADADLFSSVQSSMTGDDGHIIVESTGDGPRGLFYKLVTQMATGEVRDPRAGFVFLPWIAVSRYRSPVPPGFVPNEDEVKLLDRGLDLEQIAWRREKLTVGAYTLTRFRREYPLTWNEPFLLDVSTWFDANVLNAWLELVPASALNDRRELVQYEPYEPGRSYYAGVDTSGGVGRDEASITVLRDDLVQVARWASNTASPAEQALMLSRMAQLYPGLLCLVEANKYGLDVIEKAAKLGVKLWKSEEGLDFWTHGEGGSNTKRKMMLYARETVAGDPARGWWCLARDPVAIVQLQNIIEKALGEIEGRQGMRDDRALSFSLALWCAKRHRVRTTTIDPVEALRKTRLAFAQNHRLHRGES